MTPVISKMYCSSTPVVMVVRRRPKVTNGGGLVVTDSKQKEVFRVDGCATLGLKGHLLLRDSNGDPLLLIRRKGGVVEALSINKNWKGYAFDYEGSQKLVFTLRDPKSSCFLRNNGTITISREEAPPSAPWVCATVQWDFEVRGSFSDRECTIVDSHGLALAQVSTNNGNKDVYHVSLQPHVDQAFVFGIVAVLDHIYGESTSC